MEVILGKYAGFCHGVLRAVNTVSEEMKTKKIVTYGEIINNTIVTDEFSKNGVRIINNFDGLLDETVAIRSHGVAECIYDELKERNLEYIDLTCKDVKKIHDIVIENNKTDRVLIIIGDGDHPEIVGTIGYSKNPYYLVNCENALEQLPKGLKYTVIVQTTFALPKFNKIVQLLQNDEKDVIVYNTICKSMINRQKEAEEISKIVDIMIVLGDKKSSNSNKLYEICKKNCDKTYLISKISEFFDFNLHLELNILNCFGKIGIVAGASTPPAIIKEAFLKMSELENTTSNQSFQEMLDESFVTLRTGDIVKGTVISVSNGEVSVNLGYKSDGLIPRNEFSYNSDLNPAELLKPGDEIEVFVVRVSDGDGNVLLSKKKIDSKRSYDEVEAAFNNKTTVTGSVSEIVKGGLIVSVNGVRVFVPSSQASNRFIEDLSSFKNTNMTIEILEFDKGKRRIVGGRKQLAAKELEEAKSKIFSEIEEGALVSGIVSRTTNFGAFIDLGGIDGLIHISELSWGRIKKVSDVLAIGDKVQARVLGVDKEKDKISLTLKHVEENPWKKVTSKYEVNQILKGKVVRMTDFGAFVELEDGVDGLVHVSQISTKHIAKPSDVLKIGEEIEVKIIDIDPEKNRISLSKKEAEGKNIEDSSQSSQE